MGEERLVGLALLNIDTKHLKLMKLLIYLLAVKKEI
jgi:hypothetical protein